MKEIPQRGNPNQKDLKSGTQKNKMELNQPLSSTGPVEAGSSLSQLERLMVDRLGSTALSVKPKAKAFHKSESTPTFTFTPMATTITTASKKNEFSSSIHSKIPFKQNTQDFTKRVSNGGVQKNNYRCAYFSWFNVHMARQVYFIF